MNVLVMPLEVHSGFLQTCPVTSREYALLINSVVQSSTDAPIVEVLCDNKDAALLLDRAKTLYPAAVPYLEKRLSII